jgi:hypothetical protein
MIRNLIELADITIPVALLTVVQFIPQPPLTRSMRVYPLGWLMGDVSRIKATREIERCQDH